MARLSQPQRRRLLLEAAWRVLERDGMAAATTRAICAEAGMPQGAFHYCFTGRDELLREVVSGLLAEQVLASVDAIGDAKSMREAMSGALHAYWAELVQNPGRHQVLYEVTVAVLRDPEQQDIARYQYRRYLEGAEQALAAAAGRRRMSWDLPLPVLARQVVTVLDGLTLHYLVDGDGEAAVAALDAFAGDLARHAHRVRGERARDEGAR